MRSLVAVLAATTVLIGCGSEQEAAKPAATPTAHREQANRTCADAQVKFDRSVEGLLATGEAYARSGSAEDLDTLWRVWGDVRYLMSTTGNALRAHVKPGVDAEYDAFVAAWEQMVAQADRLEDVIKHDDTDILSESFRDLKANTDRVQQTAVAAGVASCQKPLAEGTETTIS